jgi:hypothetical protein
MPNVKVTIEVDGNVISEKSTEVAGTFRDMELAMEGIYRDSCQVTLQAAVNNPASQRPPFALKRAIDGVIADIRSERSLGSSGR